MGFSPELCVPWGVKEAMGREGHIHFPERTLTLMGEESEASESYGRDSLRPLSMGFN